MRMIRPYGQSVVEEKSKQRKIKKHDNTIQDISGFTDKEANIILGLAVGALDKIIKKPKEGAVLEKIYSVREEIGKNILQILRQQVSVFKDGDNIIQDKWKRKLHPYGEKFKEDKNGQPKKEKSYEKYQGRHYKKFIGNILIEKLLPNHFEEIAKKIYDHIFKKNDILKIKNTRLKSTLTHISNSITNNFLKINDKKELKYTQGDLKEYILMLECDRNEDFALSIYNFYSKDKNAPEKYKAEYARYKIALDKAQTEKEKNNIKRPSRPTEEFTTASVMDILKENYKTCFEGKKITDLIRENNTEFYAHEAVRDFYKKLLERHRNRKDINHLIPKDTKALIEKLYPLTENIVQNQNLNNDIRLGKIIHYTGHNSTKEQIEESKFWSSEGQKYIKRSEAFIKSWFNFITFASHSLTYLSGKTDGKDILGFSEEKYKSLTLPELSEDFPKKISFILGNSHGFENQEEEIFDFWIKKLNRLRNYIFHFHGEDKFLEQIKETLPQEKSFFHNALERFTKNDLQQETKNLWVSLEAVGIRHYLIKTDIEHYWSILNGFENTKINLPKFRTLLKRAENINNKIIPAPKVGQDVGKEYPCQYLLLKNLYDIPFRTWFSKTTPEQLKFWIEKTKTRLTKASEDLKQFSISLENFPSKFEKLSDYFEELMRLETQKGSVQKGYASDKTAQKKKANTVENFKIEVLIYAFKDYLRDNKLDYLERGLSGTQEIVFTPNLENYLSFDLWQQELYLLLHLVPVGVACDLEHQLIKYLNLVPKAEATSKMQNQIIKVFELYRQNNDVKFEGTGELDISHEISKLYETPNDYNKIFEKNKTYDAQKALSQSRHEREMARFGIGNYLKNLPKIESKNVETWLAYDSKDVENKHKDIAKLHQDWVKKKNNFSEDDRINYQKLLNDIGEYKRLDNDIRLVNHRKIHNLIMRILGRLAGFSFVYERDLYFLTFAYCYNKLENEDDTVENKLKEFLNDCDKRIENFKDGQVITCFNKHFSNPKKPLCLCSKECKPNEPDIIKNLLDNKSIRNNFAHFNMLRDNSFNITDYINDARTLMSYDRKLKNAVAKSMIGLCKKENLEVKFEIDNSDKTHKLKLVEQEGIKSKKAKHLGDIKIDNKPIEETLHSCTYIKMLKALF